MELIRLLEINLGRWLDMKFFPGHGNFYFRALTRDNFRCLRLRDSEAEQVGRLRFLQLKTPGRSTPGRDDSPRKAGKIGRRN